MQSLYDRLIDVHDHFRHRPLTGVAPFAVFNTAGSTCTEMSQITGVTTVFQPGVEAFYVTCTGCYRLLFVFETRFGTRRLTHHTLILDSSADVLLLSYACFAFLPDRLVYRLAQTIEAERKNK